MTTPSSRRGIRGKLMAVAWPVMVLAFLPLLGCPPDDEDDYDAGFAAGYAEDEWYYEGYDDSLNTLEAGPILYEGDEIPNPTSPAYERGYWDGVWTAYNDGYFDAYNDAFEEGFMDGYEAAYIPGYAEFLLGDIHIEYRTGGYDDGYNDGFSEGRVFGAYDFINGIGPDWESALEDYTTGVDLCVVGICTGVDGPVELYEYGTDPGVK